MIGPEPSPVYGILTAPQSGDGSLSTGRGYAAGGNEFDRVWVKLSKNTLWLLNRIRK